MQDVKSRVATDDLVFTLSQCFELKNVSIGMYSFKNWDNADDVLAELQEFGRLFVEIEGVAGRDGNVTTDGFKNFIKCCPRLKKLDYHGFEDNGELLKCIAQSCPLLEDIRFDTCSKSALLELSRNCKQLRNVDIDQSGQDVAATVSAAEIEVLTQIDTLEELSLTSCLLTDEKLAALSGFRHLKYLALEEFNGIEGLTGAGFKVLEGSLISKTLKSIRVIFGDGDEPVQDLNIAEMVAGIASCHDLRNIDIMLHCLCDDSGLVALGVGCPLLEEISLTYGPVTVDGLVDLAAHCQHLTKVVLDDGFMVDGPGHARAVAAVAILRSRLPHIEVECFDDFENYDDDDEEEDDDDDDENLVVLSADEINL